MCEYSHFSGLLPAVNISKSMMPPSLPPTKPWCPGHQHSAPVFWHTPMRPPHLPLLHLFGPICLQAHSSLSVSSMEAGVLSESPPTRCPVSCLLTLLQKELKVPCLPETQIDLPPVFVHEKVYGGEQLVPIAATIRTSPPLILGSASSISFSSSNNSQRVTTLCHKFWRNQDSG